MILHVLFVCNEYPPASHGGIGVFTKDIAETLVANGHRASVIGYDERVMSIQTNLENNVLVRRLPTITTKYKLSVGRYTFSFESIISRKFLSNQLEIFISEIKPDLVESYDWSGPLYKKPSIPLVVRMHGSNTAHAYTQHKRKSLILSHFERKNILFSERLISVSNYIGNLTLKSLKIRDKKYNVIYNFVSTEKFKPITSIKKNPNKILYVGRIHPLKGLTELIKCCNILFKSISNLELDIIGHGSDEYRKYLEQLVEFEIKPRVKFIGKVAHEQLCEHYNEASLFVMPSQSEAFGITAIEAMACKTTVAITDKASGPEIVTNFQNGLLIDFTNPVNAAIKINNLLKDKQLLDKFRYSGFDIILKRFSKNIIFIQNIKVYEGLLNGI